MQLQQLPYKTDSLKALFLYCCVTTLKLLKSEFQSEPIVNFLRLLEVKPHQYKASTFDDSEPSIVNSYCAISTLRELQENIQVDQESALSFVRSLVQEDGNVRSSASSQDADIRMVYSALAYLDLLNIDTSEFQQTVGKFVLMCQNQDGAFGLRPHLESHSGASYCAIASLKILKLEVWMDAYSVIVIPYKSSLIEWLVNRQCKMTGGMAGRVNKVADSCYSFWIGWTLKMLGLDLLDKERLLEFLQHCQSNYGGFSKHPQCMPDPIHTLHSLLGIMENENYDYVQVEYSWFNSTRHNIELMILQSIQVVDALELIDMEYTQLCNNIYLQGIKYLIIYINIMKMNQLIVERESDNIRKMSRLAIFNQKRFWLKEEEKQQTEEIEIEFNKLKLEEPPLKLEQQNLRKFCKNFQSFEYYNGESICINDYFIRILPVGQRCIVSSHQGVTVLKTINGLKYSFSSSLPGGSQKTLIGRCILDCFLSANTVYIYDILQWGKMDMSEQVAELRYFWIKGHILSQLRQDQEQQDYNFEWIPVIPSIAELQKTLFPYTKNGLLFIRKDSYYYAGVNPECFIYQDEFTDENFKEECIKYKLDNSITLTLSLFQNQLLTRDGYNIASSKSTKNTKVIVDAKIKITDNELILLDIKDPSKFLEDPYSKIMFWKLLPRLRIQ